MLVHIQSGTRFLYAVHFALREEAAINLRQLYYFTKIVELGNMTRAAEHLHVAQTALGIQIKNLEEELGVDLLERHSRGIRQTEAGGALFERAIEILKMVDAAANEVRQIGGAERAPIYFGITPSIMQLIGPDFLRLAGAEVPDAPLRLVEELSFILMAALSRKELDYALAFNIPNQPAIKRTPLLEERLFFIMPPGDPNDGVPIRFEEALKTDLALLSRRDIVWGLTHEAAEALSVPVKIAFEVQSVSAIKTLVERGAATSIVPLGIIAEEWRQKTLSARPIDNGRLVRTLYLAQPDKAIRDGPQAEIERLVDKVVALYLERLGEYATPIQSVGGDAAN